MRARPVAGRRVPPQPAGGGGRAVTDPGERIAIVGVGALLPGADTPEQFWDNILGRADLARPAPPGRWLLPAERAYAPGGPAADRVYSLNGCFLDAIPL